MNTKEIINHVKEENKLLASYIAGGIDNGVSVMLMYLTGSKAFKQPNWLGNNTSTYDAQRDKERILNEFISHPGMYSYGVLVGPQPGGFHLLCIDIDIDNECKIVAREMYEKLFQANGVDYRIETTKSGRYHIYFAVDEITEEIKKLTEIDLGCEAIKYVYTKPVEGKIELLGADGPRPCAVYNGIINKEIPVFADLPEVFSAKNFKNFLFDNHGLKHELSDDTINKLIEFYKLIRKRNFFNGWDIDRVLSAFCIKNHIPDEKIYYIFKGAYGDEYNEKDTRYIIERTKRRADLLPGIGSLIYQAKQLLNSGKLSEDETRFVKDFLESIIKERKDKDELELPDYLIGFENAYLYSSRKKVQQKKGVYYKEKYYVERNVEGVKEVWYVELESEEPMALFKSHIVTNDPEPISVKVDIVRLLEEQNDVYEVIINDKISYIPNFNYERPEDIVIDIAKKSTRFIPHIDISHFQRYFRLKMIEYRKNKGDLEPCKLSKNTGWNEDNTMFFHYDLNDERHELSKDNTLYQQHKAQSFNQKEQHKLVFELLREGKLLGVFLVISASSILLKPYNLQPITCIVAGNPGAGKTTAALFATSLFYKSDKMITVTKATETGIELLLASLNSLPLLLDEGSLATRTNMSLQDLIFSVAAGKGKTRGRKDLTIDTKDIYSNIFWTSETTDIDDIKRAGAYRRMLYIVVESSSDFTNLFDISDMPNKKYAGCGVDYIKFVIENKDKIEDFLRREREHILMKYKELAGMAETLYTGIFILEQYYKQYYNITAFDNLRKKVDEILENAKRTFIISKDDVVSLLQQYLYMNASRIGKVTQVRDEEGGYKYIVERDIRVKDVLGEYDTTTQTYYISTKGFEIIAKELEKERSLLHNALVRAGVMSKTAELMHSKVEKSTLRFYTIRFNPPLQPPQEPPPTEPQPPQPLPLELPPPEPIEPELPQEPTNDNKLDEIDDDLVNAFSRTTYDAQPTNNKQIANAIESTKSDDITYYAQEIMKFVSSVKGKKDLDGMEYEDLMSRIDYKPPNNAVKDLLIKFFWDEYKTAKGIKYRFRYRTLLITYPGDYSWIIRLNDAERMLLDKFTIKDFDILLRALDIKFEKEKFKKDIIERIKQDFRLIGNDNIGRRLTKKFPQLWHVDGLIDYDPSEDA